MTRCCIVHVCPEVGTKQRPVLVMRGCLVENLLSLFVRQEQSHWRIPVVSVPLELDALDTTQNLQRYTKNLNWVVPSTAMGSKHRYSEGRWSRLHQQFQKHVPKKRFSFVDCASSTRITVGRVIKGFDVVPQNFLQVLTLRVIH